MKKYNMLILFLLSGFSLFSQNSIQFSEDAYRIADQQLYYLTNAATTGNPGSDQIWDFSHLEKKEQKKSFLHPQNQREWALIFPEANMIIEENDLKVFIKADNSTLSEYGYMHGERMVVYSQAVVRFPFPFEYGSGVEGVYSGIRKASQKRDLNGTYSSYADGYGTLILPDNRIYEDVIRVRFSKSLENNLSEEVIYRWYSAKNAPISRSPLLTIFTRIEGDNSQITGSAFIEKGSDWSISSGNVGDHLPEYEPGFLSAGKNYSYHIHPNPFTDFVTIEFSLPTSGNVLIQSFDNSGQLISTILNEFREDGNHQFRFTPKSSFVQHIRIMVDDKFLASKKIFQIEPR